MARKLLLPDGKPRRVVLCDSYDLSTSTPSGAVHTLYLDDDEPHPKTLDEVHALLVKDKAIPRGTAKTQQALLSALTTAKSDAALAAWRERRLNP